MPGIWQQEFHPLVFDLDLRGEVSPAALFRFFAAAAGSHASNLGAGDETLRPNGTAWMLRRLEARFLRPATMAPLLVETWPSTRSRGVRGERDFVIRQDGGIVAHGLSTWLLIQLISRRPERMPDHLLSAGVQERTAPFPPSAERFEDLLDEPPAYTCPAGWSDLDINSHVSFPRLIEWILNAAPPSHWRGWRIVAVDLRFDQEILAGQPVEGRFRFHDPEGFHSLASGGSAAVSARSLWRAV